MEGRTSRANTSVFRHHIFHGLIIAWTCSCFSTVAGQANSANAPAPLNRNLSEISPSPQRPLVGPDADTQLNQNPSAEPIGALLDSVKGNDATIRVTVGQGRLLTLKRDITSSDRSAFIAVGDPTVIDFEVLPNPRMIRVLGLRAGVTDLSITAADGDTVSFEVHVEFDLDLLSAQLREMFPAADIRLRQLRQHLVVEGQARSPFEVTRIIETTEAYLATLQTPQQTQGQQGGLAVPPIPEEGTNDPSQDAGRTDTPPPQYGSPEASGEIGGRPTSQATINGSRVINLLRVPGIQQVLLKVRIAELNRTALREIGADLLGVDPDTGNIIGTSIGGASVSASGMSGLVSAAGDGMSEGMADSVATLSGIVGSATAATGPSSTAFGILPGGDFEIILRALRRNSLLHILAEPNLIAMSGHRANFLAGGEFPIPVPQGGGGGNNNAVTIQFREFGVRLDFLPTVLEHDRIRLSVTPEVSSIDFSLGTTLVSGGDPVPGLSTRRANTTVELREGQTLAMAGLLQVELDGQTNRIPGLGDLPILGPLFSNTSHRRTEKELLVLVTPHLVQPMEAEQVPPPPGAGVEDPTDSELYFGNRIEGRTGHRHRSTTHYGAFAPRHLIYYHQQYIEGPVGYAR